MNISQRVKSNNPTAFTIIKNAVESDKVAHAYLFSAPKNTLIHDVPEFLAQSLINENPFSEGELQSIDTYSDLHVIDGSEGLIKKDVVLKAAEALQQTTLDQRGVKILIIKNVENGNKQSLNSLLKFIEEPTPNTFILMTTNNASKVISTIRSRAQVVKLRSMPLEKMVLEIEAKDIEGKYSRLLASIAKNPEDALELFSSTFVQQYKDLVEVMKEAIYSSERVITGLSSLIKKTDKRVMLPLIRTFINDIWRKDQGFKTSFNDQELLQAYINNKFDFQEALLIINDFIVAQDSHVNFELYKSQMLIRLRRCYG